MESARERERGTEGGIENQGVVQIHASSERTHIYMSQYAHIYTHTHTHTPRVELACVGLGFNLFVEAVLRALLEGEHL